MKKINEIALKALTEKGSFNWIRNVEFNDLKKVLEIVYDFRKLNTLPPGIITFRIDFIQDLLKEMEKK